MTGKPPPPDASPYERALWPILNSSPEATEPEARELHRIFVCQRCRRQSKPAPPCDQGSQCGYTEPILTGGPMDAQHIAQKEERERRRGAPLGNTNAVKHGYYARKLHEADADELKDFFFRGCREETLILRYFIRRVVELAASEDDPDNAVSHLRAISHAVTSLARLLRTESIIAEKVDERHPMAEAMDRVLIRLAKEKRAERLKREASFDDSDLSNPNDPFEKFDPNREYPEDEDDEYSAEPDDNNPYP